MPPSVADKLKERYGVDVQETGKIPKNLLSNHDYVSETHDEIKARGLIV